MAVFDCSTDDGLDDGIEEASDAVREGLLVVLPTDTVYGLGCDAFSGQAVTAVLEAKGRGREMPPPVLVPSARTVDGLAMDVPPWARDLMEEFWPGPLTLVLRSHTSLMWDLGDTNGTVALRMPDDEIALRLLTEVGPMAVTSANLTGNPPATTVTEAATQLGASVRVYLDGGPRTGSLASTIVDCTTGEPSVLREGALPWADIQAVVARSAAAAEAAPTVDGDDTDDTELPEATEDSEGVTELEAPQDPAELEAPQDPIEPEATAQPEPPTEPDPEAPADPDEKPQEQPTP